MWTASCALRKSDVGHVLPLSAHTRPYCFIKSSMRSPSSNSRRRCWLSLHRDPVEPRQRRKRPKLDRVLSNRERRDHHKHTINDRPMRRIRLAVAVRIDITSSVVKGQNVVKRGLRVIEHRGLYAIGRLTRRRVQWIAVWQAQDAYTVDEDPSVTEEVVETVVRERAKLRLRKVGPLDESTGRVAGFIVPLSSCEGQEDRGAGRNGAVAAGGREGLAMSPVYEPDTAGLPLAAICRIEGWVIGKWERICPLEVRDRPFGVGVAAEVGLGWHNLWVTDITTAGDRGRNGSQHQGNDGKRYLYPVSAAVMCRLDVA